MGQTAKARQELARYRLTSLTRGEKFALAAVARRAGLPYLTLRLLAPFVRPPPRHSVQASEAEKAEYAAALVRVGASREAMGLLGELNGKAVPQVFLYKAHAHITQWEYSLAIPMLQNYLKASLDDYQRIVGKVNLASAFVHERAYPEAEPLLIELEAQTRKLGLSSLHGNTLERLAELEIQRRRFKDAERH